MLYDWNKNRFDLTDKLVEQLQIKPGNHTVWDKQCPDLKLQLHQVKGKIFLYKNRMIGVFQHPMTVEKARVEVKRLQTIATKRGPQKRLNADGVIALVELFCDQLDPEAASTQYEAHEIATQKELAPHLIAMLRDVFEYNKRKTT